MSESQKYFYMRLKEDFFESDAMILLESQQDGHLYSNILLKLYLRSLKYNGRLMYNDRIPFNANLLATVTRHQVGTVERAMRMFQELGLVEVMDTGAIYMSDIQKLVGHSSTEADRIKAFRNRQKQERLGRPETSSLPQPNGEIGSDADDGVATEIIDENRLNLTKKEENPYICTPDLKAYILDTKDNNNGDCGKSPTTKEIELFFEMAWKKYPRKEGKGKVSKSKKKEVYKLGDEFIRTIERFNAKVKAEGIEKQFIMHGSTFFNSGYVDYLDANYEDVSAITYGESANTQPSTPGICLTCQGDGRLPNGDYCECWYGQKEEANDKLFKRGKYAK